MPESDLVDQDLREPTASFRPAPSTNPRLRTLQQPLAESTTRVAAARTRDEVGSALAKDAARALGAACGALLCVEDGSLLRLAYTWQLPSDVAACWRELHLGGESLLAEAARSGDIDVVQGVALSAFDATFVGLERAHVRSLVLVPVVAGARPVAVLCLGFLGPRALGDDDRAGITALARVAGQALERLRLSYAEEQARRSLEEAMRQSTVLVELTAALSRAATADEMAAVVVEHAATSLATKSVSLWRTDEESKHLVLLGSVGELGFAVVRGRATLDQATPLCDAVATGDSVWISSRREAVRRYYGFIDDDGDEISVAALPLVVEGRVVGGLCFTLHGANVFPPHERGFYLVFASHVAQALDRARLFEEANDAVRVRDEFLAIASHELKTPVTSIQLQVEGALRRVRNGLKDEADVRGLVARLSAAQEGVERLTRLIDDLLDVSRIQAGRVELEREDFDLAALAADVARRFDHEAAAAGSALIVDAGGPTTGSWDRLRIDQVLTNVVSNAIKYGRGAPVKVVVAQDETHARVRIEDRGIGIAKEDFGRVFGRFERLVTARDFGGFGLGLWICREIVLSHGGEITFTSELSKGSTFEVCLPKRPPLT